MMCLNFDFNEGINVCRTTVLINNLDDVTESITLFRSIQY